MKTQKWRGNGAVAAPQSLNHQNGSQDLVNSKHSIHSLFEFQEECPDSILGAKTSNSSLMWVPDGAPRSEVNRPFIISNLNLEF